MALSADDVAASTSATGLGVAAVTVGRRDDRCTAYLSIPAPPLLDGAVQDSLTSNRSRVIVTRGDAVWLHDGVGIGRDLTGEADRQTTGELPALVVAGSTELLPCSGLPRNDNAEAAQ